MHASTKSGSSLGWLVRGHSFAAVILLPASCYTCEPDSVPVTTTVDSVIVIPPSAAVASPEAFELRVQVKDVAGNVLPDDYAAGVVWSSSAQFSAAGSGERASVKSVGAAGSTGTVTATLAVGGVTKTGSATLTLLNPMSAVADWIAGKHESAEPPMIALADGKAEAITVSDSLFAFVRSGQLLRFSEGAGNVVVFGRNWRVTDAELPLTVNCDQLSLRAALGPPPEATTCSNTKQQSHGGRWPARIRVFVTPDRAGEADTDIAYAKRAFADAWSGIDLVVTRESSGLIATSANVGTTTTGCLADGSATDVAVQLTGTMGIPSGADPNAALKPDLVTVAYVNGITIAASGITPSGLACPYDATRGTIVLIDVTGHATSTLAHELGHVFGLGHSDPSEMSVVPPFDPSNLMWASESDAVHSIRRSLTLGQTYRMTRDAGTFLGYVGAPVTECQWSNVLDTPCPRIRRDIRQR
jgi:hypothetical protein